MGSQECNMIEHAHAHTTECQKVFKRRADDLKRELAE